MSARGSEGVLGDAARPLTIPGILLHAAACDRPGLGPGASGGAAGRRHGRHPPQVHALVLFAIHKQAVIPCRKPDAATSRLGSSSGGG